MDYDTAIAYVFRAGVLVSIALILVGVLALFVEGNSNGFTLSQVSSPYSDVNSSIFLPGKVVDGVSSFRPLDLIFMGLLVLTAIPVIGVGIALVHFILQKNKLYTAISAVVVFNLMFAIFVLPVILGK